MNNLNELNELLSVVLENWKLMQSSDMDQAQDDAERFEASFYHLIDGINSWFEGIAHKPSQVAEAMELPEIKQIADQLPAPLYLPFESELESIVEGQLRQPDEKYD